MQSVSGAAMSMQMHPGKSGQSVGHMAKAAVAQAREAGAELPKNAQGIAASAIARGADPATIFAVQTEDPPPADEPPPADDTDPMPPPDDGGDAGAVIVEAADDPAPVPDAPPIEADAPEPPPNEAEAAYAAAADLISVSSAEAALELLTGDDAQAG